VTKLYQIDAGDRFVAKSAGGTIIIDGGGITLKGNVTIKGNVSITGGSADGFKTFKARYQKGSPLCIPCLIKQMQKEGK
jgi:type VI secretion system secreted protein VgrG